MQKLELNEKYLYSIMGYGSVSSYGQKCSWKCNMFSEEQLYLSNLISLRTNQTKTNYKWVFLILTRLDLAHHHLTTPSVSIQLFGNFSLNQVHRRLTANEWIQESSHRLSLDGLKWLSGSNTYIVRTWVFQVHNFIFPPYSGGEIVINSWEDHTFLLRKNVTKWEQWNTLIWRTLERIESNAFIL